MRTVALAFDNPVKTALGRGSLRLVTTLNVQFGKHFLAWLFQVRFQVQK